MARPISSAEPGEVMADFKPVRVDHRRARRLHAGLLLTLAILLLSGLPLSGGTSRLAAPPQPTGPFDHSAGAQIASKVAPRVPCLGPAIGAPCSRTPGASANGSWFNITAALATLPAPRYSAAMTYDASDGFFLLFGGVGSKGALRQDSWEFNGRNWTNITSETVNSITTPSPRQGASMVYDSADGYVVLFGGKGAGGPLSDTWTFHALTWSNITPTVGTSPPSRTSGSISDDPADNGVVLFGGRTSSLVDRDTWMFAAGRWTNLTGALALGSGLPPRRYNASMAYDPTAGSVVLFGGITYSSGNYSTVNDTWKFIHANWSRLSSPPSPPARSSAVLAYDPTAGGLLLFGGTANGGTRLSDSWSFTNSTWQDVTNS
ncbi:MAG: hypothetical protein L3J96_02350, partial [Thermoplasmata archaeon]|nr:hypothetical protein [Thermoplasmata archaeon]